MMNRNKKVVESMAVASTLLVMTTITALGGSTEDSSKSDVARKVVLNKNSAAGVVLDLQEAKEVALANIDLSAAGIERVQANPVSQSGEQTEKAESQETIASSGVAELQELAAETVLEVSKEDIDLEQVQFEEADAADQELAKAEPDADAAPEPVTEEQNAADVAQELSEQPEEEAHWENLVMANVEEDMNIRTAPDENSELAGKFYRGDVAEVISVEDGWTQITSGNVTGYVKSDYLVYGMDANQLANDVCSLYATVNADGLRLRSEPNEEAGVVTMAENGEKLKVNKEAEAADGWVAVHTSESTAYVSDDYVEVALNLGTALNSEEVAAKEAQAEAQKAAESAKKPAMSAASDEVTLLGALIQCEAGGGSYEGMVAVGAVVMNRVRSGAYPGSISGVVYQGGQFPPALNGSVANVMAGGVRAACLQAAQEAIAGTDNTNGALQFRSASSGCAGTVIGANVFF